jgi:riboflavin synthase
MFTGLVEELGSVVAVTPAEGGARIRIEAGHVLDGAELGDSIAVNGTCLTVVALGDGWWEADAVIETLERTTLGALTAGDPVNLERPRRVGDRLDGHIVQGHVDGVGTVAAVELQPDGSTRLTVDAAPDLLRYIVEKGSISVDGISLTVTRADDASFAVVLVPHTLDVTTLGSALAGTRVNLEVDVLAKYVERLTRKT